MVMTFRQRMAYLDELKKKYNYMTKHPNGTYLCVELDRQSRKLLEDWVKNHNIPNAADAKQYHTTVVYSRKGIPDVNAYPFELPISAKIKRWDIFPSQNGKKCLVAIIDSGELHDHFTAIHKQYGATYDYPDYKPHITVSYDYTGSTPRDVPNFPVVFSKVKIEPLDPEVEIKKMDD